MKLLPIWLIMLMVGLTAYSQSDRLRSLREFTERAESGDPEAMYRMSALLERGFDTIPADTMRSVEFLRRSARAGHPQAANYLGYLYQIGKYVPENPDSAAYWIVRAEKAGSAMAAHNLAFMLLRGPSADVSRILTQLETDPAKSDSLALSYLNKGAHAGLPQSLTLLGDLYAEGNIIAADTARAAELYEEAIGKKFTDAEMRLRDLMHSRWSLYDSRTALQQAVKYWNVGAPAIAVDLLRAIGPEEPETAQAYALLGYAYSRGYGVPYDHELANQYFARAALMGNPSAKFILAETLEIFPDALSGFMKEVPETLTPEALRTAASKAGITTPRQALEELLLL